jgi:hypothetical protein
MKKEQSKGTGDIYFDLMIIGICVTSLIYAAYETAQNMKLRVEVEELKIQISENYDCVNDQNMSNVITIKSEISEEGTWEYYFIPSTGEIVSKRVKP